MVPPRQRSHRCSILTQFHSPSLEAKSERNDINNNNNNNKNNNNNNNKNNNKNNNINTLVKEIVEIGQSTGARTSFLRTLSASRAIRETTLELLSTIVNPNKPGVTPPVILRSLFERLGSTYIKLGQFIASSPTLFPAEYVKEFQKCLDQTTPLPFAQIESIINAEIPSSTFSSIDPTPLASASIAQVHLATLAATGEQVVIKVQKPNVLSEIKTDMSFLLIASKVLEFLSPDFKRTSLSLIVEDIKKSMSEECDFTLEAKSTNAFGDFLEKNKLTDRVYAPKVYEQLTTTKVMTMEYLKGTSLLDASSESGEEQIITALNAWTLMVLELPFFHADVHAGNLIAMTDGRVGFIDFGIVGRIGDDVKSAVTSLSAALAVRDYEGMARALAGMGATEDKAMDVVAFGADIKNVMEKLGNLDVIISQDLGSEGRSGSVGVEVDNNEVTNLLLEVVNVTERNGLKLPREFGLLVKQSLYFDRYLKILAPDVDVLRDERTQIKAQSQSKVIDV